MTLTFSTSSYKDELALVQLRLASMSSSLPTEDKSALNCVDVLNRTAAFGERYKHHKGYRAEHVPLMIQVQNLSTSIVTGMGLTTLRGNGRLATVVDHIRGTGHGMQKCARNIEMFMGLNQDPRTIAETMVDERTGITYFSPELIVPSRVMMHNLDRKLRNRQAIIDSLKPGDTLDKETREEYLIKTVWSADKIVSYSIEYMARIFAWNLDTNVRRQLVNDFSFPLDDALESLKPKFLTAAN